MSATSDNEARQELQAPPESSDSRVQPAPRETWEHPEMWEKVDIQERRDLKDRLDRQDRRVSRETEVHKVQLVARDSQDLRDREELQEGQAPQVTRDLLANRVPLEVVEPQASLDPPDHPELLDQLETQDPRELQARQ